MMTERVDIAFKKSFSGISDNGIVFGWLKRTYASQFDAAILGAVRLVYFPVALAERGELGERVLIEIQRNRLIFQGKMEIVAELGFELRQCPGRVECAFNKSFSGSSDHGKVFGWLKDTYGTAVLDAMFNAVRLVYLPAALTQDPRQSARVGLEVRRSRLIFEEKMRMAMGQVEGGCSGAALGEADPILMAIAPRGSEYPERLLVEGFGVQDAIGVGDGAGDGCVDVNLEID